MVTSRSLTIVGLSGDKTRDTLDSDENGVKLPNKPTVESAKRMRKLLKDRLALYKDIKCPVNVDAMGDLPWTHIAANMFLCSEKTLLTELVSHVRDILADLEDEEL